MGFFVIPAAATLMKVSLGITAIGAGHTVYTGSRSIHVKKGLLKEARKRHKRIEAMQAEIAAAQELEKKYLNEANTAQKAKLKQYQDLAAAKKKEIEEKTKNLEALIKTKEAHSSLDNEAVVKAEKSQNHNQVLLLAIGVFLLIAIIT